MKKLKINALIIILCLSSFAPLKSLAWGAQGHRLIVETALSLLPPAVRQKVIAALGNNYTPELAVVWMDSVRINHVPKYSYMSSWHFLNMNANQTYAQVANQGDVVYNLQRMINFFSHMPPNVSQDSLRMNLKILFHLMGDITQPLHCGYGFDLGANKDPVTTPKFNGTNNNLHHVWDDIIIQEGRINQQSCLAYYHQLNAQQIQTVERGSAQDWMMQARSYLPNVYACNPTVGVNTNLTLAYLDKNVPVVQQQLVFASIRLANILQTAFGR